MLVILIIIDIFLYGALYSIVIECFPLDIGNPIKFLLVFLYSICLLSSNILKPLSYGIDILKYESSFTSIFPVIISPLVLFLSIINSWILFGFISELSIM